MNSPKVDLTKIHSQGAKEVIFSIAKRNGDLYMTKPSKANGKEKYIWRMVALLCSPKRQHQCFPVTASFDLQDYFKGLGYTSCEAYDLTRDYIKTSKSLIAELQDAFGYMAGTLPKQYTAYLKQEN